MKENKGSSNKAIRAIANIISILLHPVFMPLICCALVYVLLPEIFAGITSRVLSGWTMMLVLNTIIFPVLLLLLLKGLGFIKSIYLKDVKERVIPLIGIMVFYFWAYWVVKNVGVPLKSDLTGTITEANGPRVPEAIRVLLLGNFWGVIVVFLISIFFKISMHTSGVGGLVGFVLVLMLLTKSFLLIPFIIALLAALLIGWARYAVGAHNAKQLWSGYAIGIIAQLAAYLYL